MRKPLPICAFARTHRFEDAYVLSVEEVVRRAVEARDLGATEVCLQAGPGTPPRKEGRPDIDLFRAIKAGGAGASPPRPLPRGGEVRRRPGPKALTEYLAELAEAGLGSLPVDSAEVLDDGVRRAISPEKNDDIGVGTCDSNGP